MHTGQVWLITGCSTGLGQTLVEAALERGHRVVATARDATSLEPFKRRYGAAQILVATLDVTDPTSVASAVDLARTRFGAIDVLVNNAGIGMIGAVEETTADEVRRIFDVNVFGTLEVVRHVLPIMRAQRRGRIVVVSSAGGVFAAPMVGVYFASKHALEGLMEAMRSEIAPLGVSCHLVEPGLTGTGMRSRAMPPPSRPLPAYDLIREPRLAALEQPYPGGTTSPEQVCTAILDLMADPEPGFRLPVGNDTPSRIQQKIDDLNDALSLGKKMRATA